MITTTRRQFLEKSLQGSLVLSFAPLFPSCHTIAKEKMAVQGSFNSLYLTVTPDNQFLLTFDKVEMGQGVMTGQATLFGEEADINPALFKLSPAPADQRYANPGAIQITSGSSSTHQRWFILRKAGAAYRQALLKAAARIWQLPLDKLITADGYIGTADRSQWTSYATFNTTLKEEDFEDDPKLKDPRTFNYIGKFDRSLDAREKSLGLCTYAIDENLPGKKVAIVIRCPVHGGTLKTFDRASIANIPGVFAVFPVSGGLAIVCNKYYKTLKVRSQIKAEWLSWSIPEEFLYDSEKLFDSYQAKLSPIQNNENSDHSIVHAIYSLPFLAHAPLEPQNCLVRYQKGRLDIWAATQSPTLTKDVGIKISGLPSDQVFVHVAKYMGGAFGRQTLTSTIDAVEIAMQVDAPVQLIWSREDDMKFSALRPMAVTQLQAKIEANTIKEWRYQTVSQSLIQELIRKGGPYMMPGWLPQFIGRGATALAANTMKAFDMAPAAKEGAEQPYALPYDIGIVQMDSPIPTFFWRSVGNSLNGFVMESFVDEVAHAMNKDPLMLRRELLRESPRALAVVNKVAELSGWEGQNPSSDKALGLAYHYSYLTHCAQVIAISKTDESYRVDKVYTVVDCGTVVNPHIVEAQVRSSVIFGLSAALYGEITFKQGTAEQTNYNSYRILTLSETPEVSVYTMPSQEHPSGIGEPALPTVAAALTNAIFRASGVRYRSLPLAKAMKERMKA